jgi:hypothetical protein
MLISFQGVNRTKPSSSVKIPWRKAFLSYAQGYFALSVEDKDKQRINHSRLIF